MQYRSWRPLYEDVQECTKCDLARTRLHAVFGEGDRQSDIMLVGEGPGQVEDETGRPFVGPSGHLLDEMLGEIGLKRDEVYICNVVKCRPPHNRDPKPEEVHACMPYLRAQTALLKPKVIVCLGRHAAGLLLGRDVRITREHGVPVQVKNFVIIPTFHPAALLHQPSNVAPAKADFQVIAAQVQKMRGEACR